MQNFFKPWQWVILILGFILISLLQFCSPVKDYFDSLGTVYQSYDEAAEAGVISEGYLPENLPKSAKKISVRHMKRDRIFGYFRFDPDDRKSFLDQLKRQEDIEGKNSKAYTYQRWSFFVSDRDCSSFYIKASPLDKRIITMETIKEP